MLKPQLSLPLQKMPNHCLRMESAFGFSKDISGCVHSLFDDSREAVIYPASHTLVYLDCTLQRQTFLQGHTQPIAAVQVSADKRWIVSADGGDAGSLVIVWDSSSLLPIRTYQLDSPTLRIDFSSDASLIAILSAPNPEQTLQIFEWAVPSEDPVVSAQIPQNYGFQRDLKFNPAEYRQLVTNSPFQTVFWTWKEYLQQNGTLASVLEPQTPQINPSEFKTLPSAFTVSCFLPKTSAALTGTVNGEVVLYDRQGKSGAFQAIKLLQLHQSQQNAKPILPSAEISIKSESITLQQETDGYMVPGGKYFQLIKDRENNRDLLIQQFYQYLTAAQVCSQQMTSSATQSFSQAITVINAFSDGFVVTGGLDGAVRMFDFRLRLLSWYENVEAGPVTSISIVMPIQISIDNQMLGQAAVQLVPGATTEAADQQSQNQLNQQFGSVVLRDFIVATQRASIILVPAAVFEFVEPERRKGQLLYQGIPGRVTATYTVPRQETTPNQQNNVNARQYIATDRGDLLIFDYKTNQIVTAVNLLGQITASHTGNKLKGSLAQRHSEGFEQCCYLVPIDPRDRISTMLYSYITCITFQPRTETVARELLVCGTNVGTCMLIDAQSLQLLSSFSHLTQQVSRKLSSHFKAEKRDIAVQIPSPVKFVKVNNGDCIAVVDQASQLCLLYKTKTEVKKMDLVTGQTEFPAEGEDQLDVQADTASRGGARTQNTDSDNQNDDLAAQTLLSPPRFVVELETEEKEVIETQTVSGVRIHPAALLARANQKRRDAAQTAGQWQNLGKVLISHSAVTDCQFIESLMLYDEVKNEPKPNKRANLVLLAEDRFLTIIDIQQSIDQVEADKIIIDRRMRVDQEQIPTSMCVLPRPAPYEPDLSVFNKSDSLKDQINLTLSSLQCEKRGLLNATMRPELQPVDQRDLLLISTDQYKLQVRQLQRFNQTLEVSSKTILSPQQLIALQPSTSYFLGGYPCNYPPLLVNVPGAPPAYIPGAGGYAVNTRLAGPLPLRKTVLGPTFAQHIDQMLYISQEAADKDLDSNQVIEGRHPYRTDYEVLNSAGSVKHRCQYVAFKTPQKVIGVMRTPLDGALNKYVGLISSAGPLLTLDVCYVVKAGLGLGKTFFISTGVEDCCCFNYQLDFSALDLMVDTAVQNGQLASTDPFLAQIDQSGGFYKQIQEYFSYAQIYISEQRGVSPSEEPIAPVSMLPEILRALGIFLNNEQMANAVAELTEEDVRQRRLRQALGLVKKAFNERRLPCPFDQREGAGNQLEFTKFPDLRPFQQDYEDFKSQERFWEQDADTNYQFEQSLYEVVGNKEVMMSLSQLIRIIVNYRQLYDYDYDLLEQVFQAIGARDRQSFQENITKFGEKMEIGELQDMLGQINNQSILPEIINVDEFAAQYLKLGRNGVDIGGATNGVSALQEVEQPEVWDE